MMSKGSALLWAMHIATDGIVNSALVREWQKDATVRMHIWDIQSSLGLVTMHTSVGLSPGESDMTDSTETVVTLPLPNGE